MKKVLFMPANMDGCALYRMFMVHLRYIDSVYCISPKDGKFPTDILNLCEVVSVQRQTTYRNLQAAKVIKAMGKRYVYDLDDNLWHVPKYNPAYNYFREQVEGTHRCLKFADHVTVSTSHLASVVKRKVNIKCPVSVVENAVDFSLFGKSRMQSNGDRVVIGWAGTNTHALDLQEALSGLMDVMRLRKNVYLEFMGGDFPVERRYFDEFGKDRFLFRPWAPHMMWPAACSSLPWDISLAPLLQTSFNSSKSNIKMLESAARSCPCVASATAEYVKFCGNSSVLVDALICPNRDSWKNKLLRLVDSESMRKEIGQAMYERAYDAYNMEKRVKEWSDVFQNA